METPETPVVPSATPTPPVVAAPPSVAPEAPPVAAVKNISELGRGRPKKDGSPNKATAAKLAAVASPARPVDPSPSCGAGSVYQPVALDTAKPPSEDELRQAAKNYCMMFYVGGSALLGAGFFPAKDTEKVDLENAVVEYFRENGITKPPAWLGIVIAAGSYTANKVLTVPECKEKGIAIIKKITAKKEAKSGEPYAG